MHAPVFELIVSVDRLFSVMDIILEVILDLGSVETACFIDFVNGDLGTIFNSISIDCGRTCGGSDSSDIESVSLSSCVF